MAEEMIGTQTETIEAEQYKPGELAPAIITPREMFKPDDLKKLAVGLEGTILDLVKSTSLTDEAARRFSVLQTWQNRHMDRGYQYLETDRSGGWTIAGAQGNDKNPIAAQDDANLYPTNIFSAQGDIATGALNRGEIKVNFFPSRSKVPLEVACASESNRYKHVWRKYNPELQRDITSLAWTDCRALVWTRSVADCARFGYGDDSVTPRVVEISTPFGVMESRGPMMNDKLCDWSYAQLFEEQDYAIARAAYPWMGDKIKPSWGTAGELEFERVARINTRIGMMGRTLLGSSGLRETTMAYTWLRPGMFWDDKVRAEMREVLLKNFEKGLFVITAGENICCCWEESMDDHLALAMFTRGFGQNRRALGESDVPIQKRINIWSDLWDKTVRGAIPTNVLDSDAFNAEAVAGLESSPTRFIAAAVPEGRTMADLYGQLPAAQLHPGFAEMLQWYLGPLIQSIDGATPALFGGGEGEDNTVGATQIRLQQSLERYGPPWMATNRVIARAAQQAAKCCGENGNSLISDNVPGEGDVTVDPTRMAGNPYCEPETLNQIPESGAQRQAKVIQILDMAQQSPQAAALIATPSNAREIVKALGVDEIITVDEAESEDLALENIETLLDGEPLINPAYAEIQQQLEQMSQVHSAAKEMAAGVVQSGQPLDPEEIEQGQGLEDQEAQLQKQLAQTPQYLPSIPVPDDESLDYSTIAATVFAWMQQPTGRGLRRKAAQEQEGGENWKKWTNVFLYWKANKDLAAKFTQASAPPPKVNITGKLTPEQQSQILLQAAGIQTDPSTLGQPNEVESETIQRADGFSEVKQRARRRL